MRIGVLTGGGDCPGLNAVLRAIVKTAKTSYGSEVIGFRDGWRGLLDNQHVPLDPARVDGIITRAERSSVRPGSTPSSCAVVCR